MIKRWFLYLTALFGCLVFYISYQQWVAWIVLLSAAVLPLLSLMLSLPAWLTSRVSLQMPHSISSGTPLSMALTVESPLPVPPYQVLVQTHHTFTGHSALLGSGFPCQTEHCGALNCKPQRIWLMDYLGLFRIPLRKPAPFRVLILPQTIPISPEPDLSDVLVNAWRPKPGGGFSENYELRLYRPGDNLQQIHWKLTAKTGNLILREPMIPDRNRLLVWMTLQGTPTEMDIKLGKLRWMAEYLLQSDLPFDLLVYTAQGQQLLHIPTRRAFQQALMTLLCHQPTTDKKTPVPQIEAHWQYHIGGQAHEET